jgi:hypothetical protein
MSDKAPEKEKPLWKDARFLIGTPSAVVAAMTFFEKFARLAAADRLVPSSIRRHDRSPALASAHGSKMEKRNRSASRGAGATRS